MQRVPEPTETMEELDQALAYAKADFAEVNRGFVERFTALCADDPPAQVLDLGCGPGDIPIRLCRAMPGVHVTGVDGSTAMLNIAELDAANAGLAHRIDWVWTVLPDPNLPAAFFDGVMSNSLLHHMNNPMHLWHAVERAAAPGAHVMVMDLCRPESSDVAQMIVDTYSADEPEVLKRDFYNSLMAAYRLDEVREQLAHTKLAEWECVMVSDRHWAVTGRR